MRAEPEGDVAIGCTVEHDFVSARERCLVVIGRKPADDYLVVAPKLLSAKDGISGHGAAQRLGDRAVSKKLVRCAAVELRAVDQLRAQFGLRAEVQQAQRSQ